MASDLPSSTVITLFDPLGVILAGRESVRAAEKVDASSKNSPKEELRGFLWFTVGGESYAVEIHRVKEVLRPRRVTTVPRSPEVIRGIISHRGAILAILDLAGRLGVESVSTSALQRIIAVRMGEGCCGLLVNRVGRVVMRPRSAVEPPPRDLPPGQYPFVSGTIRYKGAQLLLLDLDKILDIGGSST